MAERQQDHCWISHGGRRARGGKKEEVREREGGGSQEEGSARLGRGGNHGGTCHNDKPGLGGNDEGRRCGEDNEVRRVGRDQPQWQAGPL